MQGSETELIIPLIDPLKKPGRHELMVFTATVSVLIVACSFLWYGFFSFPEKTAGGVPIPNTFEDGLQILFIVLAILAIAAAALFLTLQIRTLRTPHQVRINQEGIFYSYYLSIFVRWDEVTALVPLIETYAGGSCVLSIVLRDEAIVFARFLETNAKHRWQKILYRFLMRWNRWCLRSSNAPSPVYLPQSVLPLTIAELITMIQECFAAELREYHIPILDEHQNSI